MKQERRTLNILLLSLCFLPLVSRASVVISEVAWMGSADNHNAEWIEVYNNSDGAVDLTDWRLEARDGQPAIVLSGVLQAGGYALLERTSDDAVRSVPAYLIYTGSMSNDGEYLELRNANGVLVDAVDGSDGWSIGGDNETKETLQRSGNPPVGAWVTDSPTPEGDAYKDSQSNNMQKEVTGSGAVSENVSSGNIIYPQTQKKEERTKLQPSLRIDIGDDRTVIVGVPTAFTATTYTESGRETRSVAVTWNFGDGSIAKGREVTHTFLHEGEYVVSVTGERTNFTHEISKEESIVVHAIDSPVHIAKATGEYIALANESSETLELSGCVLVSGSTHFKIPENTYVLGSSKIILPRAVTSIDGSKQVSFFNEGGTLLSKTTQPALRTPQHVAAVPTTSTVGKMAAVEIQEATEEPSTHTAETATEIPHAEMLAFSGATNVDTEQSKHMWWWILGLITAIVTSIIAVILVRQEQIEVIEGYYIEERNEPRR